MTAFDRSSSSSSTYTYQRIHAMAVFTTCFIAVLNFPPIISAFNIFPAGHCRIPLVRHENFSSSRLYATEDDISRQVAKAKQLLEDAKKKMAAQEAEGATERADNLKSNESDPEEGVSAKRSEIIKSKDESTGLITTDGELMASLSELEEWEARKLLDVFESEIEESEVSKQLASRDVAASIQNLRISMHDADYRKIFDSRNRFIGEN